MEPTQIFLRQIDAAILQIFPDITDDIGHLQSQPQFYRVLFAARVVIAKDLDAYQADGAGDSIAINPERIEGGISQGAQVHFYARNDFFEHVVPQRVFGDQLSYVAGEKRLALDYSVKHLAPSCQAHPLFDRTQLCGVSNVVDDAAKRVENGDIAFSLAP